MKFKKAFIPECPIREGLGEGERAGRGGGGLGKGSTWKGVEVRMWWCMNRMPCCKVEGVSASLACCSPWGVLPTNTPHATRMAPKKPSAGEGVTGVAITWQKKNYTRGILILIFCQTTWGM